MDAHHRVVRPVRARRPGLSREGGPGGGGDAVAGWVTDPRTVSSPPERAVWLSLVTPLVIQLFERTILGFRNRRMAVSPDGQRFLLLAPAAENADSEATPSQIVFVQHWFEELRRLVPTN